MARKRARRPRKCTHIFKTLRKEGLAVTYRELTLKSGYSTTLPADVDLGTRISRRIKLRRPYVSSPMDRVTEAATAIAIAKFGGAGFVHRNLTPEKQRDVIKQVKLSGMVIKPETIIDNMTLGEVIQKRQQEKWKFHSLVVIDSVEGKVVGLMTERNFTRGPGNPNPRISEIMTPKSKLVWLPPNTTIDKAYRTMVEEDKKIIPLIDKEGFLRGMYLRSDINDRFASDVSLHNTDANGRFIVGAAVGTGDEALRRVEILLENRDLGPDLLVIDMAHGDTKEVVQTLRDIKSAYDIDVGGGSIAEGSSARRLIKAGADFLRVGMGPGSICITGDITGCSCPQMTAIDNVVSEAEGSGVPVCADGGITQPGDVPKALGAGAACVMIGMLFAGTNEAPGEIIDWQGSKWKFYRGMGSKSAIIERLQDRYNQEGGETFTPEGIEGLVPYVGSLESVINQLVGGLRRGMSTVGAATIRELQEKADFYRRTDIGSKESSSHDIRIAEFPNFRSGRP